jgi:LPS export ABC transporter protein LptC
MSYSAPPVDLRKLLPLALLAAASLWFASKESDDNSPLPGAGFTKDVDYYLKGVTTESFDANGDLRYQLQAELAQHYRSNDSVELEQPIMQYRINQQAAKKDSDDESVADFWHIAAERGWFYEEQPPRLARLELKDQVVIKRRDKTGAEITTITDEMWFLPGSGELHSQSPVLIQQGTHRIRAARLSINTNQDRIRLHGGVKGAYYPATVDSTQQDADSTTTAL